VQEALFPVSREARPLCLLGRIKSIFALKMEARFLTNVGSYKSHTESYPTKVAVWKRAADSRQGTVLLNLPLPYCSSTRLRN
jgi:hypothetical protein